MADYSIWVLGEDSISFPDDLTGTVELDGVTQGDGSHLVGETLQIDMTNSTLLAVTDAGAETNFADNDSGQRLNGDQVLDGVLYTDNTIIEAEYEFTVIDDSTGIEYTLLAVNIRDSSPSYATIEGLAFVDTAPPSGVPLRVISAQEGPNNGGPGSVDAGRIVPICFVKGTAIAVADGDKPVEELRPGDLVRRVDGTFVPVCRVFQSRLSGPDLRRRPQLCPVRITAGALGAGLPLRDLSVSRQHRMLVSSKVADRMFGQTDVLIPAFRLTALPGIYDDLDVADVTYVHVLFDQHELILAEGAPSESLYLGPETLGNVPTAARAEIIALFPEIAEPGFMPVPAVSIPTGRQQKQLVARHAKNQKPPLELFGH